MDTPTAPDGRDRVATVLTVAAIALAIPVFLIGLFVFGSYIDNPRGWCDVDAASSCGDWTTLSGVLGYLGLAVVAATLGIAIRRNQRRYSMIAIASLLLPLAALAVPMYDAETAPVCDPYCHR